MTNREYMINLLLDGLESRLNRVSIDDGGASEEATIHIPCYTTYIHIKVLQKRSVSLANHWLFDVLGFSPFSKCIRASVFFTQRTIYTSATIAWYRFPSFFRYSNLTSITRNLNNLFCKFFFIFHLFHLIHFYDTECTFL
jgi:hypothetical protein